MRPGVPVPAIGSYGAVSGLGWDHRQRGSPGWPGLGATR